jgi:hypothetical protein
VVYALYIAVHQQACFAQDLQILMAAYFAEKCSNAQGPEEIRRLLGLPDDLTDQEKEKIIDEINDPDSFMGMICSGALAGCSGFSN